MKMIYQRRGGPILSWASGYPPHGYRASETRGLGDTIEVEDTTSPYILPGQPERISGLMDDMASIQGVVGMAVGAFHGYKRTKSIAWAAGWAFAGAAFPLFTGIVAFAQGFGVPKQK